MPDVLGVEVSIEVPNEFRLRAGKRLEPDSNPGRLFISLEPIRGTAQERLATVRSKLAVRWPDVHIDVHSPRVFLDRPGELGLLFRLPQGRDTRSSSIQVITLTCDVVRSLLEA